MKNTDFFESVVEPSSERLGIFGIANDVNFDGRHFVVTHKVSKNIMAEFDGHLSRYLSAVTGAGLPGAAVETRIRDVSSGRSWSPYPARQASGLAEALAIAIRLALGSDAKVRVRCGPWMGDGTTLDDERAVSIDVAHALDQAVHICNMIGPPEFLDVSGDLNRMVVRPTSAKLDMLSMDMERGTIAVPTTSELAGTAYQGALYGFEQTARQTPAVGTYLSRARHYVSLAQEEAIYTFRQAAEGRILEFNEALAGRELSGHRLDSAQSLVARLQAGLGDTLLGLSEAAQLTALDWAMEVRQLSAPNRLEQTAKPGAPSRPKLVR
ncbi:MAG: hypothetical protein AB8B85_05670 [Paracoccaceae bacterium]